MKILAVITARGGSKRLPGKNLRLMGGKPLVTWSIDIVKNIPQICDVLVSTDDLEIAEICTNAGASVPWLRPEELSGDEIGSVDVALHALDWFEAHRGLVDGLLLLQPTSPFRSRDSLLRGIEIFEDGGGVYPVLGVSQVNSHPMWMVTLEKGFLRPIIEKHGLGTRSQDLPPVYISNGAFYLISPRDLREHKSFFNSTTLPLLIESEFEAIDIDTEHDWCIAESYLEKMKFINEN